MIELLEPLKDSLEALSLELESEYTEDGSIEVHDGRLDSLAHMTALQILDTSAEMWKYLCADELELEGLDPDSGGGIPIQGMRLCRRLSPSLHTLIFHLSPDDVEPAFIQMSDLVQMRPDVLPNLEQIAIGTDDKYHTHEFDQMLREMEWRINSGSHLYTHLHKVNVGGGRLATVFDAILSYRILPDTRWFGHKYSTRWRQENNMEWAIEKMARAYQEGRRGTCITDVLADEPGL
jgi:hypothetical protein